MWSLSAVPQVPVDRVAMTTAADPAVTVTEDPAAMVTVTTTAVPANLATRIRSKNRNRL